MGGSTKINNTKNTQLVIKTGKPIYKCLIIFFLIFVCFFIVINIFFTREGKEYINWLILIIPAILLISGFFLVNYIVDHFSSTYMLIINQDTIYHKCGSMSKKFAINDITLFFHPIGHNLAIIPSLLILKKGTDDILREIFISKKDAKKIKEFLGVDIVNIYD